MYLTVRDLGLEYGGVKVFSNVSFSLDRGEVLLLTGRNGSGKTSLLKILSGIIPWVIDGRVSGEISLGGVNPLEDPGRLVFLSRYMPPNSEHYILAPTPFDDIGFSLSLIGRNSVGEDIERIAGILGMKDFLYSPVTELSSGQAQKTLIAGTIAVNVGCLLLDEPLSHLDRAERERLIKVLGILKQQGSCMVVSTHYPEYFTSLADSTYNLGGEEYQNRECRINRGREPGKRGVLLRAEKLGYTYPLGREVIREADLTVYEGEVVVLYGRNASGKSTLLRLLAGVLKPTRGSLEVKGKAVILPPDPVKVFTQPTLGKELKSAKTDPRNWFDRELAGLLDRPITRLSNGELKKAAFTLLASQKPSILLLDEPEAGLDPGSRCQLASLMARLSEEGVGIVLATHDEEFGRLVGDKFYTIEEGVVSEV